MSALPKVVAWFEIPSVDFDRAVRFYEAALDVELNRQEFGGQPIATFGYEEPATGGAIVHGPSMKPAADGVTVYLNAQPTVNAALARIERAGGKTDGPVIELPQDIGYIAFFIDTEGNRVGLHSRTNG
ncbi:VOC family protein [Paraburkholderia sp. Ac-20336]|uniref:VOC family protein n=1 Tax=Burkholderiaceae TaxID=119060 RepID=UPI00142168C1|nr:MULTISPECIES: VOC family protein [Burkholderiaceae]MBN3806192.1 VOC family protein [Paraburkholderia sp. Ac-20336]NIF50550.1 VOC family protein [Burkholderia sp. Ax-1724]NIF80389.1 VOC family protein [Paraburkholderia sp. Cy-641]